jgi:hypothetical protein
MTRFRDKTESEQREEVRNLLLTYSEESGTMPTENQLNAAVDRIMNNLTTPMYEVVNVSGRYEK